jgi:two-component system cell cycle response regulator
MKGLSASPRLRLCAFSAMGLGIAFELLRALTGVGGRGLNSFADNWLYMAVEFVAIAVCLARVRQRREQRLAWALVTFALVCWSVGDLLWAVWLDNLASPPFPSAADVAYLLMYPAMYGSLMILIRSRARSALTAQWLDGGVVALAVGAVTAVLVFSDILRATTGRLVADAVTIAYPVGDVILLMFVVIAFALAGWRPGRDWLTLGSAVTVMAIADIFYADQVAGGLYVSGDLLNVGYLTSFSLLALAAWMPSSRRTKALRRGQDTMVLTGVAAVTALALLVVAAFTHVTPLAVSLAGGALGLATARSWLTYLENGRILRRTRVQAVTDALTELGNRRRLLADLETLFDGGDTQAATLAFFDLNGFKRYNDTYGHAVGDALLVRLATALRTAVSGKGSAYRLGGDEFCVLLEGHHPAHDQLVASTRSALTERGAGFDVTASLGVALIPDEAGSADDALRLADERMYADKGRTERSPVRDVLMQLLNERTPGLLDHSSGVTIIAAGVAAQFSLEAEDLDETLRAAELHDIGKLAIPDAILNKPGPLDPGEWAFMQQHPVIGQRILDAAAALTPVGLIVRASHERWDGGGYPDGLRGEAIPLGARIIAVCDAYDAMTSDRCYQLARSHEQAMAELRHNAGTQFDPTVVAALERHVIATGIPALVRALAGGDGRQSPLTRA